MEAVSRKWKNLCRGGCGERGEENCLKNERKEENSYLKLKGEKLSSHRQEGGLIDG
jgi:hypothetical protein